MSMKKMLRELTDQLYKYNASLENKVLKSEDIEEEEENLKDILKFQKDLQELLLILKKTQTGDLQKDNENLMRLHVILDGFSWYFQNIHKVLMAIIKNYPDEDND